MLVGLDLCFVLSLALVYITRKKRGKSENYKTPRNESQTLKNSTKPMNFFKKKLICYDMFQNVVIISPKNQMHKKVINSRHLSQHTEAAQPLTDRRQHKLTYSYQISPIFYPVYFLGWFLQSLKYVSVLFQGGYHRTTDLIFQKEKMMVVVIAYKRYVGGFYSNPPTQVTSRPGETKPQKFTLCCFLILYHSIMKFVSFLKLHIFTRFWST